MFNQRIYSNNYRILLYWCVACVCLLFPAQSFANDFRVIVIPSSDSIIYSRAIDSIKETINHENLSLEIVPIDNLEDSLFAVKNEIDLIVPVGQLALEVVMERFPDKPVLASLVTRLGFYGALNNTPGKNNKVGAIFIDQPLERQLLFTRLALPKHKRLGFLISRKYKDLLPDFNSVVRIYKHHTEIYENGDNLIQSLSRAMENSDVIVALPDTTIFNRRNTHNILLSTYRKFIPLIGFSKSYVRAGALAAIFSTPNLIGEQTGELINTFSKWPTLEKVPRSFSRYFQVSVNNKVARSLGLSPLDEDALLRNLKLQEQTGHD
ncbi:ABC transporter substrate-binding protein [Kaarinaea lacus]